MGLELAMVAGMKTSLPLLAFLLIAACGTAKPGDTTIEASDYDQACVTSADCVAILAGDVCPPCSCPTAAINVKDAPREGADLKERLDACPSEPSEECGFCGTTAACVAQRCVVEQPGTLDSGM